MWHALPLRDPAEDKSKSPIALIEAAYADGKPQRPMIGIRNGRLITEQNRASSEEAASAVLKKLA